MAELPADDPIAIDTDLAGPDHPAGDIRIPSTVDAATRLYARAGVLISSAPLMGIALSIMPFTTMSISVD